MSGKRSKQKRACSNDVIYLVQRNFGEYIEIDSHDDVSFMDAVKNGTLVSMNKKAYQILKGEI